MALTAREKYLVTSGDPTALARALKAAGYPVTVIRNVASGDLTVLVKALGLTSPQARAVLNGDYSAIPAAVQGNL